MRLSDYQRNVIRGATRRRPCLTPASTIETPSAKLRFLADTVLAAAEHLQMSEGRLFVRP